MTGRTLDVNIAVLTGVDVIIGQQNDRLPAITCIEALHFISGHNGGNARAGQVEEPITHCKKLFSVACRVLPLLARERLASIHRRGLNEGWPESAAVDLILAVNLGVCFPPLACSAACPGFCLGVGFGWPFGAVAMR